MAGAHIFREKGLSGWLGRVFLEKRGSSGWLGRVFLEKKACLDGWGAYFSRKGLPCWLWCVFLEKKACLDGWRDLSEIQEISPEFSFMVFDYNSYVKVVILGNLCGGAFRTPQGGVFRGG